MTASFVGVISRTASYLPGRGCVLDAEPDPSAQPHAPAAGTAAWPQGDGDAKLSESGIGLDTHVVDAFAAGREPEWAADWCEDGRSGISVGDLFRMTSGLDIDEGYNPWDPVVQMLYGEPDMAGWAAGHGLAGPPGTTWEYLSAASNILAEDVRAQFATDPEFWV